MKKLFKKQKKEKKGELSSKVIERLNKFEHYDERNYEILFEKPEKEAKEEAITATKAEIDKQIEILIGKEWTKEQKRGQNEVNDFRKKCHEIFLRNNRKLRRPSTKGKRPFRGLKNILKKKPKQTPVVENQPEEEYGELDLPRYVIPEDEPEPEGVDKLVFVCGIHIDKGEQFQNPIFQAINCTANKKSNVFLEEMLERANRLRRKDSNKLEVEDWVLKVTGSLEYIYGDMELFKFESIRKALKYGKPYIELNLMKKETELKNLDKYQKVLEHVDYKLDREYLKPIDHDKITINNPNNNPNNMEEFSIRDIKCPFSLFLGNMTIFCDNKKLVPKKREKHAKQIKINFEESMFYVNVKVVHGDFLLGEAFSQAKEYSRSAFFNQYLEFQQENNKYLMVCDLPRESVVLLTVYLRKKDFTDKQYRERDGNGEVKEKDIPMGSISFGLIDYLSTLKTGWQKYFLNLAHPANLWSLGEGDGSVEFTLKLPEYTKKILFPTHGSFDESEQEKLRSWENTNKYKYSIIKGNDFEREMETILKISPIQKLTGKQKWVIWNYRNTIISKYPLLLPKLLLSVPWNIPQAVQKTHSYLNKWPPLPPLKCLELLDYKFPDQRIRIYAVKQLNKLKSQELFHYILQLSQTLKFELYHDSALSRFLLQRALQNQDIGQSLFWYLKSEMHIPSIQQRYGLILEEFLRRCAGFRIELLKQNCVIEQIYKIALAVKQYKGAKKEVQKKALRDLLSTIKFPQKFKLPLTYRVELNGLVLDKCRMMSSAKLPLFLSFSNVDKFAKENYVVLFKAGDDIKQDVLVLQMLRIMDNLWKSKGLDLHIRAYGSIATGDLTGLLEIVKDSETTADIAFSKGFGKINDRDIVLKWLESNNQKNDYEDMKENFMKSCAGYCVATYVLGLGDRHNDNVMISKKGDLFHIDFGHFLNHKKKFLGIKRETTPFVFTKAFAHVMGGSNSEKFSKFKNLAISAYNILRNETDLLIVLLMLMMGCGLVEMQSEEDIEWVENAMVLEKSDKDAGEFFEYLINVAMNDKRLLLNDNWHILFHKVLKS